MIKGVLHAPCHENGEIGGGALLGEGLNLNPAGHDGVGELDNVGTDGGASEGEDVVECWCLGLAPSERLAAKAEELANSGDNGGVLVVTIVQDCVGWNARGNEDSGDSHADTSEVEGRVGRKGDIWDTGGRGPTGNGRGRDMVEGTAMFVVEDKKEGAFPARTLGERIVDVGDKGFTAVDRKVGVLTVGEVALAIVVIGELDEGIGREVAGTSVSSELGVREKLSLMQHEVLVGNEDGRAVSVDAKVVEGSLVEALEDGMKQERRVDSVLIDRADGVGAMHEHAVGDGGARDGGEPAVAERTP